MFLKQFKLIITINNVLLKINLNNISLQLVDFIFIEISSPVRTLRTRVVHLTDVHKYLFT